MTILDPRYKLDYIRFCYGGLDSTTCDSNVAKVKKVMEKMYAEYAVDVDGGAREATPTPIVARSNASRDVKNTFMNNLIIMQNQGLKLMQLKMKVNIKARELEHMK